MNVDDEIIVRKSVCGADGSFLISKILLEIDIR